jgi:hypothetical protein
VKGAARAAFYCVALQAKFAVFPNIIGFWINKAFYRFIFLSTIPARFFRIVHRAAPAALPVEAAPGNPSLDHPV